MESNRQELDPIQNAEAVRPVAPEAPPQSRIDSPEFVARIAALIKDAGGNPAPFEVRLVQDLLSSGLKLIPDGRHAGELKLITAAVKELRYAYNVFAKYPDPHKVTIFGSARTPKTHPDYAATVEFSKLMAQENWMIITGAGGGIMEAGHVGPGREKSFGVAIRLPFEQSTNDVIAGDSKLIHFRYFFTRKLMFISQSEAVAVFPGGFGTMDEGFEVLTLIQTGKASMVPIVFCEGAGETYWEDFLTFVKNGLLNRGWISADDLNLFKICKTPAEAVADIKQFYRNYHSSRYVRDDMVIRIRKALKQTDIDRLSADFKKLFKTGVITQRGPYDVEDDHLELPRLAFTHTRRDFGTVRQLIDRINLCEPA